MLPFYSQPPSAVPSSTHVEAGHDKDALNRPSPLRPIVQREISFARNVVHRFSPRKEQNEEGKDPAKLPLKERIRHFTWTWFTMTMATGGLANVMYLQL